MNANPINWPDGCTATIEPDGRWDLTLPTGRHVRGQATDPEAAEELVNKQRDLWILTQWDKGEPIARQRYIVPLT